ncbi:MAG: peptidoglycan DD-metalloendopeptidase family protein [Halanaerobiales bacterium]
MVNDSGGRTFKIRFKHLNIFVLTFILFVLLSIRAGAIPLKKGDRGPEVEKVQNHLNQIGYDVSVDGNFGEKTQENIKNFQNDNGLVIDGIVGENTYDMLQERALENNYTVKKGDTLSELAQEKKSSVEAIIQKNNIQGEKIKPGQELIIPEVGQGGAREESPNSNIIHEVEPGEALITLAKRYGTDINTIKLANNLKNSTIYTGQNLVIPHSGNKIDETFKLEKGNLIWPVMGRISSNFGWRIHPISDKREFHNGVDVAVPIGTEIRAAAGGQVIYSGWKGGYGKTVVIDHGQGIQTYYAHNSRLLVREGTFVKVGEKIAGAGSTGTSTGPHLHFGLKVNGEFIEPLNYLP